VTETVIQDALTIDIDPSHGGDVVLLVYTDFDATPARYRLDAPAAMSLLSALTPRVMTPVRDAAQALVLGDCPTCLNRRTVSHPDPARSATRLPCQTCKPSSRAAGTFPDYPRVGGGVR